MLSREYEFLINNNWWNWFNCLPDNINSFERLLNIFKSISNKDDFKHFRRNFPPEWLYIPATRVKNKELWLDLFSYIYDYHMENDEDFKGEMSSIWIKNKIDFIAFSEETYNRIQSGWLDYEKWQDLTVTFCKEKTQDIIKKYCSGKSIDDFNVWIKIHPIERKWSINKVLFYRATNENKYNEKMFNDYEEWKNTKRVCKDFLEYYYKKGYE